MSVQERCRWRTVSSDTVDKVNSDIGQTITNLGREDSR